MKYRSTRGESPIVDLPEAIANGLAPDGGLYIPDALPKGADVGAQVVGERPLDADGRLDYLTVAKALIAPFAAGTALESQVDAICEGAFDFPIKLVDLGRSTSVLELFHGPSAAFKDFGARFLAECMTRGNAGEKPLTIMVATSGDTGGAVASAFWKKPNAQVFVFYPHGKVSSRQEHQLTCWDTNIRTFAVEGVFDDCQKMVKDAFSDSWWNSHFRLTSANSINIGRLLPQMTYYAWASLEYQHKHGRAPGFVVPSGNLGNALACVWARAMGFPIREIMIATNANRPLVDWIEDGKFQPRPTVATIANAMDVGGPSNMERLLVMHATAPDFMRAVSYDDDRIRAEIKVGPKRWGQVFCPHTACAMAAREEIIDESHWIVVATAHPAKFETVVEPLVGHHVEVPPRLGQLLERPTSFDIVRDLGETQSLLLAE